ncbi:MAG: MFS transporter [Chloroflexi bacterium]|nr:MFS transporter [Chloroflexota bacterium]
MRPLTGAGTDQPISIATAIRRLLVPLYLPAFFFFVGVGMLVPTLPLLLAEFGVSYTAIAVGVAVVSVGTILFNLPAGVLLGRFSNRVVTTVGALVMLATTLPLVVADEFTQVLLLRLVFGCGLSMVFLSRVTLLGEAVDVEHRGRATAVLGGTMRISRFFLGPALVGLFGAFLDLRALFAVAAAFQAVAALASWFGQRGEEELRRTETPRTNVFQGLDVARVYLQPRVAIASAGAFLGQFTRAARLAIIPFFGAFVLDLDASAIGYITAVGGALDMVFFPLAGWMMDRLGRKFCSVPSFTVMGLGMFLVAVSDTWMLLLVASAVLGIGNGLGSGALMTLGVDLSPPDRISEFLGAWRAIGEVGELSGSVLPGQFGDSVGFENGSMILGAIGLFGGLLILLFVPETLKKSPARVQKSA